MAFHSFRDGSGKRTVSRGELMRIANAATSTIGIAIKQQHGSDSQIEYPLTDRICQPIPIPSLLSEER